MITYASNIDGFNILLAHLSQRLKGELIGYPWSGVRRGRPQFQTSSPLKPLGQSMEPPWEGRTKVHINGTDHMTKMAATPIYGKNLLKYSSPEPEVL